MFRYAFQKDHFGCKRRKNSLLGEVKRTAKEPTLRTRSKRKSSSFSYFSMLLSQICFPRLLLKLFSQTSSFTPDANPSVTLFEITFNV